MERQLAAVVQRTDGRQMVVRLRDPDRSPQGVVRRLIDWLHGLMSGR